MQNARENFELHSKRSTKTTGKRSRNWPADEADHLSDPRGGHPYPADQIDHYGGRDGVRDINLLSSAVAMPYATYSAEFLHRDIFEMAAAYAFHVSQNHPFVDGNKRTALASALVFLEINSIDISDPDETLYESMIKIASGKMTKEEFSLVLRNLSE